MVFAGSTERAMVPGATMIKMRAFWRFPGDLFAPWQVFSLVPPCRPAMPGVRTPIDTNRAPTGGRGISWPRLQCEAARLAWRGWCRGLCHVRTTVR